MENTGLTQRDITTLNGIFARYPSVVKVFLFGSRAKGKYKPGSDIDLAIMNEGVSENTLTKLKEDFEESLLPYYVDIVDYHKLSHKDLKEHIERAGILFYSA